MKKIMVLSNFLLFLVMGATALSPVKINSTNAIGDTGAGEWRNIAGPGVISSVEDGTQIEGEVVWAARCSYGYKVKLDGLNFTYYGEEVEAGDMYGFYFSSDGDTFYADEQTVVINNFYKTGFAPTQTSIFCLRGHDYNQDVINYSAPDVSSDMGFHQSTDRLVCNNVEGHIGFNVKFSKYNDEWYQMDLTELWEGQFWEDNLNYVKDGNFATVTTYLKASDFPMDGDGNLYLMSWGIRSSVNSNTPRIQFKNISDEHSLNAENFANKVLNDLTCDPSGATAPNIDEWYALEDAFIALSATSQKYINNASGTLIKTALEKYDYIINKYNTGYGDFLGRKGIEGSQIGTTNLIDQKIMLAVISTISIISVTGIAYLLFKKKRSESK